jgi:hypothetical protein
LYDSELKKESRIEDQRQARISHTNSSRSSESADLNKARDSQAGTQEDTAGVLLSTSRRPTDCNTVRSDGFAAAEEGV